MDSEAPENVTQDEHRDPDDSRMTPSDGKRALIVGLALLAALALITVPIATSEVVARQPVMSPMEADAYHRGVADALEAVERWMPTAGPKLLRAIKELRSDADFETWFERRYEPTGSGRIAQWLGEHMREQTR